jgi:nitroreductase
MNETLQMIHNRRSVRAYAEREIGEAEREQLLQATLRAPTAGNMMLYSIVEVRDQAAKDTLAVTCDHQPFIAKAPLVWLFLADYQRWVDYFALSGIEELCKERGQALRTPEEGDLFLACCDALIAAQTAVIAAEALGIGSCYIGDVMENYEAHRQLFQLPQYVFPICMLCFGYPTEQQQRRPLTSRFDKEHIVFQDRYRRLGADEFDDMYRDERERSRKRGDDPESGRNIAQQMYLRKFSADYSVEMSRSVRAMLRVWMGGSVLNEAHQIRPGKENL